MSLIKINSIKGKIISAIMIVTIPIILITSILLTSFTISSFKNFQKEKSIGRVNFIKAQAVPAMLFQDSQRGEEILKNLENESDIEGAYILNSDGSLFAKFEKKSKVDISKLNIKKEYAYYKKNRLLVSSNIKSPTKELLGTIHIISNNNQLNKIINMFLVVVSILTVIMITVTYLLANKSQKAISKPILTLAAFAKSIGENKDKKKRITLFGNDEIGILYKRFNDMLDKIDERDSEINSASELLHDVINSTPSILIVINEDEKIELYNDKATNYFSKDDVETSNIWTLLPSLVEFKDIIKSVLSSNNDRELRGVKFKLKEIESADLTIFPLNDSEKTGTVILITDVTDANEREQQLIQIQKMETVGTLAGGLAHDFNNVMGGIVGTVSLMEMQIEDEIDQEELKEDIEILNNAAQRATNMVGQLLSLSHKSDTKLESINIVESLNNVVKILSNSIDKSVKISTSFYRDKALVLADSNQLEQIFLNIAINGSHAMTIMRKEGEVQGGTLTIAIDKWELKENEKTGVPAGEYQHISISDTGAGIPEKIKEKIFDPFFTTKGKGKGTGLGLSMVYNLIKKHDGHLIVDSAVGKGTSFHILFPKTAEEQFIDNMKSLNNTSSLNQVGTILIIDDEFDIRFVARKILEKSGYKVLDVDNGKEGIELYSKEYKNIDLILLDMVMPHMSGEDVYPKLQEISKEVTVLLSSGFKQDDRVQNLINMGIDGFIHKPYKFQELSQKVFDMING